MINILHTARIGMSLCGICAHVTMVKLKSTAFKWNESGAPRTCFPNLDLYMSIVQAL